MLHVLRLTGAIFIVCAVMLIIGRGVARAAVPNTFIQELIRDSQLENAQWTWRDVYPGRDTMQRTVNRLTERNEAGDFQHFRIALYQSRIEWTTNSDPAWQGQILTDSDLPPPHVYAVLIRPPSGQLKLGDALLLYGLPLRSSFSFQDTSSLCFASGVCVSFATPASGRLLVDQEVQSVSYMTSRVVERSLSAERTGWQGFRRY